MIGEEEDEGLVVEDGFCVRSKINSLFAFLFSWAKI
jgi:hypothetical protein